LLHSSSTRQFREQGIIFDWLVGWRHHCEARFIYRDLRMKSDISLGGWNCLPSELLKNVSHAPIVSGKYNTDSSVYTDQSILNFDSCELVFCIANIIQSEIFDQTETAPQYAAQYSDLSLFTALPPHLGGHQDSISDELLNHETKNDPDLRTKMLAGQVPAADTILRFISWIFQSSKYSPQCNILAFIYIKRIIRIRPMLSFSNWRGIWLGAIMLAQKLHDDIPLRTSSFTTILPGVAKEALKTIELRVFELVDHKLRVKPSAFAKFYFELRAIFQAITGSATTRRDALGYQVRPLLNIDSAKLFEQPVDERPLSSSTTVGSGRPETLSAGSATVARPTLPALPALPALPRGSIASGESVCVPNAPSAVVLAAVAVSEGDTSGAFTQTLAETKPVPFSHSHNNSSSNRASNVTQLPSLRAGGAPIVPEVNAALSGASPVRFPPTPTSIKPRVNLRKTRSEIRAKLEGFVQPNTYASTIANTNANKYEKRSHTRKLEALRMDGTGSLTVEDLDFVLSKSLYIACTTL